LTPTQNLGRVYSVELNKYMNTISLDQALKAIQEFVDNNLTTGTKGLIICVDKGLCSPEVTSYITLSPSQSLRSLSFTTNPHWEEGLYESKFAKKSVTEESYVPLHQRYKVGDKFKIVSLTPSILMGGYSKDTNVGDVFEIVSIDTCDDDQPYLVKGAFIDSWPVARKFLAALEAGAVVLEEEVPFHQKYKVGDKFKIAKGIPESFSNWFDEKPKVNDVLVVTEIDREDPERPYSVSPEYDKSDYAWGSDGDLQKLVENGYLVPVVSSKSETPFHERYKEGDKFRVAKDLSSDYQGKFIANVKIGDVLVITDTDPKDEPMPYKVAPEFDKFDYTWGEQFQQLVESGVLVYQSDNPETTESYDTIVLNGVTYNLVPQ